MTLAAKVQALHTKLNELYALDPSWAEVGEWPDGVTGSILHPPASEAEIAALEAKLGFPVPPSYRAFMKLHAAWEHGWGDTTLIGAAPAATQRAQDTVARYVEEQRQQLEKRFGPELRASIAAWEAEDERNLYLGDKLVIGTAFRGDLLVYDSRTRRADGEMTLRPWTTDSGLQEPDAGIFDTFDAYVDFFIKEVDWRIECAQKQDDEDDEDEA